MRVTEAWLTYILVVLGVYLILTLANCHLNYSQLTRLLIALVVGLIVTLFIVPSIVPESEAARTWYSLLLVFSVLAPLALALWMAWSKRMIPGLNEGVDRYYECEGEGEEQVCRMVKETRSEAGKRAQYLYRQ